MSKPDEIPQDVWDAADAEFERGTVSGDTAQAIISRAILAERERCAALAERRHAVWGTREQVEGIEVEDDYSACKEIATAIRGGSK